MRYLFFSIGGFIIALFSFCSTTSKTFDNKRPYNPNELILTTQKDIPYVIAQRYFSKGNYNEDKMGTAKITSREVFDSLFGMSTVMGVNGKPTPIDFSTQYVLSIVIPPTEHNTVVTPVSLKQSVGKILLSYKVTEGEKRRVTIQPLLLLVVDNKYKGDIEWIRN